MRIEGVRVDDRGDRVGGVVKAIHELEPQRHQKRHAEKNEGKNRRRMNVR
jgi:hypothetical protein